MSIATAKQIDCAPRMIAALTPTTSPAATVRLAWFSTLRPPWLTVTPFWLLPLTTLSLMLRKANG